MWVKVKCNQMCDWNSGGECQRRTGTAWPLSNLGAAVADGENATMRQMIETDMKKNREIRERLYRLEELTQAIAIDLKYMLMEIQRLQAWWMNGPDVPGEGENGND